MSNIYGRNTGYIRATDFTCCFKAGVSFRRGVTQSTNVELLLLSVTVLDIARSASTVREKYFELPSAFLSASYSPSPCSVFVCMLDCSDPARAKALRSAVLFLGHRFPNVRKTTAEALYLKLLANEEIVDEVLHSMMPSTR